MEKNEGTIVPRNIVDEMSESYLDYAMSVIISRALPDVRDGLKPVHRRILYAMWDMGLRSGSKYRKSAAVIGEVLGRYHPHGDSAVYDAMVRMAQEFSLRYPLVHGQGNFGCFTGNTKIKLLDGTERSFEQLSREFRKDERFAVYSVNKEGEIVVGWAHYSRVTRHKAEIIEVTLNTGDKIRCTPDHRFFLRKGIYKQAKDLTTEDSLMSGYFRTASIKEKLNEYLQILQPKTREWQFVHRLADKENEKRGRARSFHGPFVRHHKNFNRFDNRPENIERLSFLDHLKIHTQQIKALWRDPVFRKRQAEGVKKYFETHPEACERNRQRLIARNTSSEFIEHSAQTRKKIMKERYAFDPSLAEHMAALQRTLWKDPVYRKKMSRALRGSHTTSLFPEQMEQVKKIISEKSKLMWQDSVKRAEIVAAMREALADQEVRKKISNNSRRLWRDPGYRARYGEDHFSKMAKALWARPETMAIQKQKVQRQWGDPAFREKHSAGVRAANRQRVYEQPDLMRSLAWKASQVLKVRWQSQEYKEQVIRSRILRYGSYLLARFAPEDVTPDIYQKERYNNAFPGYEKMLRYFPDLPAMLDEAKTYNHRVVSVRTMEEKHDVWDITVDEYHNFLLASGVFVHNSIDGDSAAAYRYTEAKLQKIADELLFDIDRETVAFAPNYDNTTKEPSVLPTVIPNLLLNGTVGIAVGMATNIPPHNLNEVCNALIHRIECSDCSVDHLMEHVKGPDFPTGGIIYDTKAIKEAYATGRGGIVMRAKTEIVENKQGFHTIIVAEVPYQVNKANVLEKIADLVREKKIEGIKDLRDESSKEGIRVVIELKKDAYPKKILNQLFKHTQLQDTFHVNLLALIDGIQPRTLTLKVILEEFIKFRREVVVKRTEYELGRARDRAHILEGLHIALASIDAIIKTIKQSKDRDEAKINLMKKFKLSERQAVAILEMKLSQLANLERQRVEQELKEKRALIKELESILSSPKKLMGVVKKEIEDLKSAYGDERRTQIIKTGVDAFKQEDLIPNETTLVLITRDGYIKRLPTDTFKVQSRGGKGIIGLTTKEEDVVDQIMSCMTHNDILFFTTRGRVFQLKAYDVPVASRTAKGQAIVNFLSLSPNEKVSAVLSLADLSKYSYLMTVTTQGLIKKTEIADFVNVRRSGLIAVKLKGDDLLEWVKPTTGKDEVLLVSARGQAIRFREKDIRPMGRAAAGVRGIRLKKGDSVVGMDIVGAEMKHADLLTVMENGYGKRSPLKWYKAHGRGGLGIKTAKITDKTGPIVMARAVDAAALPDGATGDLLIMSSNGQVIRIALKNVPVLGRQTQGVRVMRFKEDKDTVATVTLL